MNDTQGQRLTFKESEIKVEDLVPLMPKTVYEPVKINLTSCKFSEIM